MVDDTPPEADLDAAVRDLAGIRLGEDTLEDILDRVAELARQAVRVPTRCR